MKISIITATFNSGKTLHNTLNSVLIQSLNDWEHIIIDGGSNDNTLEIIKEFEPKYGGRLKWISEPDKGIYDAMNKGIRMATGDIIGILNSDDFFSSNEILKNVSEQIEEADAIYGDVHYVDPSNLKRSVRNYSSRPFRRWMMRLGFMPAHPSFYCRRRIYQTYGLFDTSFRVAADFEQLLRLIFINRIKIKYIPLDFVTMRTGGASSSGWKSHKQIIKDHIKAYRKNGVYSNYLLEGLRYIYKVGELALS